MIKKTSFLFIFFSAYSFLSAQDCTTCHKHIHSETEKRELHIDGQKQVIITTDCAEFIKVTENETDNFITIFLTKTGSKKHFDDIITDFKTTPSHITIEAFDKSKRHKMSTSLALSIPKGIAVSCHCRGKTVLKGAITEAFVETNSEPVTIQGIKGTSDIRTTSGDISIIDSQGTILAHTSTGETLIENPFESIHVTSTSGDIRIQHPQKDVNADTQSGNIFLEMAAISAAQIIRAKTSSGNVLCSLPQTAKPSIVVYQKSGDVYCDNFRYKKQKDSWFFGKPTPPQKEANRALVYINAPTGNITFNIFEGGICCQ